MSESYATDLQDYERRELAERVAQVVDSVRRRGDDAVREHSCETSCLPRQRWRLDAAEIRDCVARVSPSARAEIASAQREARRFADAQRGSVRDVVLEVGDGARRGLLHVPVPAVALLVPAGGESHLPALEREHRDGPRRRRRRIVGCAPPTATASTGARPSTAMALGGVDEIHALGGVAGVAALAFGTETIDAVDRRRRPGASRRSARPSASCLASGASTSAPQPDDLLIIADDSADAGAARRSAC